MDVSMRDIEGVHDERHNAAMNDAPMQRGTGAQAIAPRIPREAGQGDWLGHVIERDISRNARAVRSGITM